MRLALAEPKYLKDSISIISELVNEARFKITPNAIELVAMDPANVAMVIFKLLSSSFTEYDVKKETELAINLLNLKQILKNTEILSLNSEEAKMLVKGGDLYRGLRKLGPKIVCVTNGEKEGRVYDGEFLYRYFPNVIKVDECTGAGDAFGSSFVTGLIKGKSVEDAIRIAMANSESVIQKKGAQEGLLSWNGVLRYVKKKRFRIERKKL